MTSYRWDTRCADLELARLERGFTGVDHANFARVFFTAFATVVKDVHVETGGLLSSIKAEPIAATAHRWESQISAGGASAGVNNPVRYAASEFFGRSLRHGGPPSHDYFRNVHDIDDRMVEPAGAFISRGRHTPHPEGPLR